MVVLPVKDCIGGPVVAGDFEAVKSDLSVPIVRAFVVFVSGDELVAQDWAQSLSVDWPQKGGPLNHKVIGLSGSLPALAFREFSVRRFNAESAADFKRRLLPGLVDILFTSPVTKVDPEV